MPRVVEQIVYQVDAAGALTNLKHIQTSLDTTGKRVKELTRVTNQQNGVTTYFEKTLDGLGGPMTRHINNVVRIINRYRRWREAAHFVFRAVSQVGAAIGRAVLQAAQFNREIARVDTLLIGTGGSADELRDDILRMSSSFGTGASSQVKAFYTTLSSGVRDAADSVDVMDAANKLAVGGGASLESSISGITQTLLAYQSPMENASVVADLFTAAAASGATTVEQLSANIGKASGAAAQAEIPLSELLAATAALSNVGVQTDKAFVSLNNIILAVQKSGKEAKDEAKRMGIDFSTTALRAKGLGGFLREIATNSNRTDESLSKLFPNVRGLRGVFGLVNDNLEKFDKTLNEVQDSSGRADEAFNKVNITLAQQIDKFDALGERATIAFGDSTGSALGLAGVMIAINTILERMIGNLDEAGESDFWNRVARLPLGPISIWASSLDSIFAAGRKIAQQEKERAEALVAFTKRYQAYLIAQKKALADFEKGGMTAELSEQVLLLQMQKKWLDQDAAKLIQMGVSAEQLTKAYEKAALAKDVIAPVQTTRGGVEDDKKKGGTGAFDAIRRQIEDLFARLERTLPDIARRASLAFQKEVAPKIYSIAEAEKKLAAAKFDLQRKSISLKVIMMEEADVRAELEKKLTEAVKVGSRERIQALRDELNAYDNYVKATSDAVNDQLREVGRLQKGLEASSKKAREYYKKMFDVKSGGGAESITESATSLKAKTAEARASLAGRAGTGEDVSSEAKILEKESYASMQELHASAVENMKAKNAELRESALQTASAFSVDMVSALMDLSDGTITTGEFFKQMVVLMLQSSQQMITQMFQQLAARQSVAAAEIATESAVGATAAGSDAAQSLPWYAALAVVPVIVSTIFGILIAMVQKFAKGGMVRGGVAGKDSVPAMLMPGEYVIPKRTVDDIRAGRAPGGHTPTPEAGSGNGGGSGRWEGDININVNSQAMPRTEENLAMIRSGLSLSMNDLAGRGVFIKPPRDKGRNK